MIRTFVDPFGWAILLLSLLLVSCATPVAPTGGEPDRTPPEIVSTSPESGTVQFRGREIEFRFSTFLNRGTFQEALQVEPDLGIPYEVDLGRKSATVEFSRDLPENTTVILRLGTELEDARNNSLGSPYTFALSTGEQIDEGVIQARIFSAETGRPLEGANLFLYREPFDPDARATYVAQSDTSGRVSLSYLAQDTYRAVWVEDLNRNRQWEQDRERAYPFHEETVELSRGDSLHLGKIFIPARPDTTSPSIEGVGLLTSNYLRLRASEELYWSDQSRVVITDTTGTEQGEAAPLYLLPDDSSVLMAQADMDLDPDQRFQVRMEGFEDASGNPVQSPSSPFSGSAQPDTIRTRIIGDNQLPGLHPDEPLIVGYNKQIVDPDITDSLRVVAGDRMIEDWPDVDVQGHRLVISPDPEWTSGRTWQFLVWNPFSEQLRPIEPTIWHRGQLGGLDLSLEEQWRGQEIRLHLESSDGSVQLDTTLTDSLELRDLPPLTYQLRLYEDRDGNGEWSPGQVVPFQAPEPFNVYPGLQIQEGFDAELLMNLDARETESGESSDGLDTSAPPLEGLDSGREEERATGVEEPDG